MKKKNVKSHDRNNEPDSASIDITETVIGTIQIHFTESGLVLIDNGNILDVGLRKQILEAALAATQADYDKMKRLDEETGYLLC